MGHLTFSWVGLSRLNVFQCQIQANIVLHDTLVPEVFFRHEETREERERSCKRKPLVVGDANLTIMLRGVTRID